MTFEEFGKQADNTIAIAIEKMKSALNASSIEINSREIQPENTIHFILCGAFNLSDSIKIDYVNLNIKYPNSNQISFLEQTFKYPDELDKLFQMIKERIFHSSE